MSNLSESPVPIFVGPRLATNGEKIQLPESATRDFTVNSAFSPLNIGPNRVDDTLTKVLKKNADENTRDYRVESVEVRSFVGMYFIYYYGTSYNRFHIEKGLKQ